MTLGRGVRTVAEVVARAGACAGVSLAVAMAGAAPVAGSAEQHTESSLEADVRVLASDGMGGRQAGTEGSALARDYIIERLASFAEGLGPGSGADAFTQEFPEGVNVVGVIPGGELADEFVVLGAHYDHLGTSCPTADPADTICNGATDNATGVAAVLAIGESLANQDDPPRRSVVLAFWDAEEIGLLGSLFYVENPLVPVEQTAAYLNFDILGGEILPSLRSTTFAIASETGGDRLASAVRSATEDSPLDTHHLSWIFGQGRSDYINFIQSEVPTVFLSDSTGPCYHTAQDDLRIVDFDKLAQQVDNAAALTRDLVDGDPVPSFVPDTPLATFEDAVELKAVADKALVDLDLFPPEQQDVLRAFDQALEDIVAGGAEAFGDEQVATLLAGTANTIDIFTGRDCIEGSAPPPSEPGAAAAVRVEPVFTG